MRVNYYRKFGWFWMWLLVIGAAGLLLQACADGFRQRVSVLGILPDGFRYVLLPLLVSGFFAEYLAREGRAVKPSVRMWRMAVRGLVVFIYADRCVLGLVSRCLDISAMEVNPEPLLDSMIFMAVRSRRIWWNGILGTLELSLLGTVIGFLAAVLLVFIRVSVPDKRDRAAVQLVKLVGVTFEKAYVAVVRGTPMMVQACVVYYGGFGVAKALMAGASITQVNQAWSFFTAGLITVSMNTAAYLAEALRGGIEALDKGQREAAQSLGFTHWQAMMKVIFPQAVKNSMPAIGNEFINNIKGTSVLNIIGVVELMFATGTVAGYYYKYLASYCVAALIYLVMTFSLTGLLNLLAARLGVSGRRAAGAHKKAFQG